MITAVLVLFTGLLGLVILLIILFGYRSNRIVNLYLGLIIFVPASRLILIGIKDLTKDSLLESFVRNYIFFGILIIPILYLYFKNLIVSQKKYAYTDLYHFILPLLFFLEIHFSLVEKLFHYQAVLKIRYLFFIYILVYDVLVFLELKKHIWIKRGSLEIAKKHNNIIRNWSNYLYVLMNLLVIRIIVSMFMEVKSEVFISGEYGILISAILWLFIFIKMLATPEILHGYYYFSKLSEKKQISSTSVSQWKLGSKIKITNIQDLQLNDKIKQNIENYISTIETALAQNSYFRDPKFSINDLASKLNISKSHLTFLFKYYSKISFSDFKKIVRIQDAVLLIDQDYLQSNTLESLAQNVGFASYNTFFTSFKDVMGTAPLEYVQLLNTDANLEQ